MRKPTDVICLNCRGPAHPPSLQRTPGSADYARLMEPVQRDYYVGNVGAPPMAFLMTLAFVLFPGPYQMAVFTFLAQPLFAFAGISYFVKVLRDLRQRKVV